MLWDKKTLPIFTPFKQLPIILQKILHHEHRTKPVDGSHEKIDG